MPPHYCFRTLTHIFQQLMRSTQNEKTELITQKNRLKRRLFKVFGRSAGARTQGLLLPNLSGILFPLVYSGFRRFLICFTYSLTLLSPLFPRPPKAVVVKHVVVEKHSRGGGRFAAPRERLDCSSLPPESQVS